MTAAAAAAAAVEAAQALEIAVAAATLMAGMTAVCAHASRLLARLSVLGYLQRLTFSTPGSWLSALGSQFSALGSQFSALSSGLSTLISQLLVLSSQLSAIVSQFPLGSRLPAFSSRPLFSALCSALHGAVSPAPLVLADSNAAITTALSGRPAYRASIISLM